MTNIQFHKEIYAETAIEQSLEIFSSYGTFSRIDTDDSFQISVEGGQEIEQSELVGEFSNYVLVETIKSLRAQDSDGGELVQ